MRQAKERRRYNVSRLSLAGRIHKMIPVQMTLFHFQVYPVKSIAMMDISISVEQSDKGCLSYIAVFYV